MDWRCEEGSQQLALIAATFVTMITDSTDDLIQLEVLGYLLETIGAGVLAIVALKAGAEVKATAQEVEAELASLRAEIQELKRHLYKT